MQELWTAFRQRMAGLNIETNFTYTHQALVTNITGAVTNYYLTNSIVTVSNDLSGVWFTQQPLKFMLNQLFPLNYYGSDSFVTSQSVDNASNTWESLPHSFLAGIMGGYATNLYQSSMVENEIVLNHRAISNLSVAVWAATNSTLTLQGYGNYTYSPDWTKRYFLGLDQRALSNSVMSVVYRPGSTNAGNLTVTLAGCVYADGGYYADPTNEQVTIEPNGTQALSRVFLTTPMLFDGLRGDASFDPLILTVNSGTVNTGDQVVAYLDRVDLYTAYFRTPFWNTRTVLNSLYLILDEMRCCIVPGGWSFLDGYIGQNETDRLAYSNRTQQTGMAFSLDGGGTGYGRLASWNGPVWAGTYNIYPASNQWNYATLWTVTNSVLKCWTGQTWEMQYRWTPYGLFGGIGTFDDNGLGYTQDVIEASSWIDVTNAAMVFAETMGATNPASITPDDERGFRATVPTLLLRLDTDTNFICTPR